MEDNKGKFSETLQIKPDGRFKLENDSGTPISRLAHLAHTTSVTRPGSEDAGVLYELAYNIQKILPELNFAFKRDKEGKSITYNVSTLRETKPQQDPLLAEGSGKSEAWNGDPQYCNDEHFVDDTHKAYGVFDSGTPNDAAEYIRKFFSSELANIPLDSKLENINTIIKEKFNQANQRARYMGKYYPDEVRQQVERTRHLLNEQDMYNISIRRGSTTASVVKLWEGTDEKGTKQQKAIIANVGDSRVYIQHEGKLRQISEDDGILKTLDKYIVDHQQRKRIREKLNNYTNLSELSVTTGVELKDEVKTEWGNPKLWRNLDQLEGSGIGVANMMGPIEKHLINGKVILSEKFLADYSWLTKKLGDHSDMDPANVYVENINPGDAILLVTDGVHRALTDKEMEGIMNDKDNSDPKKANEALLRAVDKANEDHNRDR